MRWLIKLFKGGSSNRGQVGGTHHPPQFIGDENMVSRAPVRSLVNIILLIISFWLEEKNIRDKLLSEI